jgi:hypothetical protein
VQRFQAFSDCDDRSCDEDCPTEPVDEPVNAIFKRMGNDLINDLASCESVSREPDLCLVRAPARISTHYQIAENLPYLLLWVGDPDDFARNFLTVEGHIHGERRVQMHMAIRIGSPGKNVPLVGPGRPMLAVSLADVLIEVQLLEEPECNWDVHREIS